MHMIKYKCEWYIKNNIQNSLFNRPKEINKMAKNKNIIIQSVIISVVTFISFYFMIAVLLDNELIADNILAMSIYSLLVGLVAFVMTYYKLRIAFYLFVLGHFIGMGFMAYAYLSDVSGWEEIIGFLSYMIFLVGGLVLGLIIQVIYYFYSISKKTD